jgi:hypothetical protein
MDKKDAIIGLRDMVNNFFYENGEEINIAIHSFDIINRTYIINDLFVDIAYLIDRIGENTTMKEELWIRTMGTFSVLSTHDVTIGRDCWGERILGKILIECNGSDIELHWVQDDDCLIKNKLVTDLNLNKEVYERTFSFKSLEK